jgi:hypothetical protein
LFINHQHRGSQESQEIIEDDGVPRGGWATFSRIATCCFPNAALRKFGMHDKNVQLAWREKMVSIFNHRESSHYTRRR